MNPTDEKDLEVGQVRRDSNAQERADAAEAEASEHNMTTREALRFYWKVSRVRILCGAKSSRNYKERERAAMRSKADSDTQACGWSMLASTVLIMEGFDGIGGNFSVLQTWLSKYGKWNDEQSKYYLPADWQMGLSEATSVGCLIGVLIGAWQVDRFGYRLSMIANLTMLSGFLGTFGADGVDEAQG